MKHLSAEKFNVDLNHPKAKFYSSLNFEKDKEDIYKDKDKNTNRNRNKNKKIDTFSNTYKKPEKEIELEREKEKKKENKNEKFTKERYENYMVPILTFHQLRNSNSKITCNNFPNLNKLDSFVETYGINAILSCNEDNYYRNFIRKEARSLNLYYLEIRINLNSMNLFKYKSYRDNFISDINDLYNLLINEKLTLLINSSCGEKRLAIIVFCLLIKNGEKPKNAIDILLALKKINKSNYQDSNIDLLIKYVLPYL